MRVSGWRAPAAGALATKAEVYVEGARAVGATARRLVLRHIVPNCVTPLLVQASVLMAIAILVEAALSFLGVGVRPPTPSLGLMLSDGRGFMLQAPWVVVFPGLAILIAVLERNYPVVQSGLLVVGAMFMLVNLVTDVLYGLLDPRLRRR